MRRGIGCGLVAVSVLGLGSRDSDAQIAPLAPAPARTAAPTATLVQVDWASVPDKAMKGATAAVSQWQVMAGFARGKVNAIALVTQPGDLQGPSLFAPMQAQMIADGVPSGVAEKFARAFADAWAKWQSTVIVPGLPVYPAFAAFPGPMAPPMPNVPFPLAAAPSPNMTAMSASELSRALKAQLGATANDPAAQKAVDLFSAAIATSFTEWLASQQVMLVLGKGPVPTYAPPYVPVGAVLGGDILPGQHFVSGPRFGSTGAALLAFEAAMGQWKVKLESGKAFRGPNETTLAGTIAIRRDGWPVSFRLRDAVLTLKKSAPIATSAPTLAAQTQLAQQTVPQPVAPAGATLPGGVPLPVFVAGAGAATVEVTTGGTTLTYPTAGVRFAHQSDGSLGFEVDTFSSDVCRIQLGAGSGALQSGARLKWKMACPHDVTTDADLLLTGSALTGNGTLTAYNASFGVSYSLDTAQKLMRIKGAWTPGTTAWRGIPGLEQQLEYAIENPKVTLEWSLPASAVADAKRDAKATASMSFTAGKLVVRTKANRPSGAPWATASTSNVTAQMFPDGTIRAPFPQPPQPPEEPRGQPLCSVSCDFLKAKGMLGAVPPAPPMLRYNADQSKCEVTGVAACTSPTVCPAGSSLVDEGGVKKCRVNVPSVPQVPAAPRLRQIVL